MPNYVFKEDEPVRIKAAGKANAQVIGDALEEIRQRKGGELEPKHVVETARAANHPLHPHFEWDDKLAAEAFRVDQARNIIRIVRIVDDQVEEGSVRAFLSVPGKNGTSYRTVEDVKRSADLQDALLGRAQADLESCEARYRELRDICAVVASAREAVQRKRRSLRPDSRAA